jgi:hypothetical protein
MKWARKGVTLKTHISISKVDFERCKNTNIMFSNMIMHAITSLLVKCHNCLIKKGLELSYYDKCTLFEIKKFSHLHIVFHKIL